MGVRCSRIAYIGVWATMALGLMALGASPAQALQWKILGATFAQLETEEVLLSGAQDENTVFLLDGLNTEILCSEGNTAGWLLLEGLVEMEFFLDECEVFQDNPPKQIEDCEVPDGIVLTTLGSLFLHSGLTYVLFQPAPPEKFTGTLGVFKIDGEGCVLPEKITLKGNFATRIWPGAEASYEKHITTSSAIESLFPASAVTYGGKRALLTFLIGLELGGDVENCYWTVST